MMSSHEKGRSPKYPRNVPDGRAALSTQASFRYDAPIFTIIRIAVADYLKSLPKSLTQRQNHGDKQSNLVRSSSLDSPQLDPCGYSRLFHSLTCGGEFAILWVPGLLDPAQADSADATVGLVA